MIREATYLDLSALLDIGERMHDESPHFSRIAFDRATLTRTLLTLMDSPNGFVWVAEQGGRIIGVMVAVAVQHWCSTDLVASEMALFVEREHRGGFTAARLVKGFTAWAAVMGCKLTTVGVSTGVNVEQTARLYERLGLKRFGIILEA